MAGASAAIVYNNLPYGTIIMASGSWAQLIEDAYPESLEASLTNLSEHSIRLTVDQVTMVTGQIKVNFLLACAVDRRAVCAMFSVLPSLMYHLPL
eukprot:759072-Hanusia_phi.AAC.2